MRNSFLVAFLFILSQIAAPAPLYSQSGKYDPAKLFSAEEVKSDLLYYKKKLEKIHSGLYRYTSNKEMNSFFDSLSASITHPMTELGFYNTLTLVNEKIKDGHTILLPSERASNYFTEEAKHFPIYIHISGQQLFLVKNCSADTTLIAGDEITSINGETAAVIIQQLLKRQIRDGYNQTYPEWILNTYFKSYYGFLYGHPGSFDIHFSNAGPKTVRSLTNDSIAYFKQLRYPDSLSTSKDKKGITLTLDESTNTAWLRIRDFHNEGLKNIYHQSFKKTIAACFTGIFEFKAKNLVIDIRDNQGGDIENGEELLSWLMDKPFSILEKGPSSGTINPQQQVFKGNVYILINGGSFSNSAIISSFLQRNKRAIFIGEESGGNRVVLNGNARSGDLPHTGIQYQIPGVEYLIRTDVANNGHGVIPDHLVNPSISDISGSKDRTVEFVLQLLKKN